MKSNVSHRATKGRNREEDDERNAEGFGVNGAVITLLLAALKRLPNGSIWPEWKAFSPNSMRIKSTSRTRELHANSFFKF